MLEKSLSDYISDPQNPDYNFALGKCYEDLKQYAAAIGFYIRTAEFGDNRLLAYESFLRIAICFEIQGHRTHTLKGVLLRTITILPQRPEAYFLMARTYEVNKDWHEAYAWAIVGDRIKEEFDKLKTDVQYPGKYGFKYERAVVAWWIGLYHESLALFKFLEKNFTNYPVYSESIKNNISNITNILKSNGKYSEDELQLQNF
jgi:hypothetical protein